MVLPARKALASEDSGDNDVSSGADAANELLRNGANELFQNGLDLLKSHSKDFDARIPLLSSWYTTAFVNIHTGPRGFESARDAMVNLCRYESGLRRQLENRHDLSFFERLPSGHQVQRLPIGLEQIIRTTDDEIIISGGGENFQGWSVRVEWLCDGGA
jgi:hypothetical protein